MRGAGRAGAECVRRRLRARTRGEDGHYKVEAEYVVLSQLVEGQAPGTQHVVRQVVQARLHLRRRRGGARSQGGARLRDAARQLEAAENLGNEIFGPTFCAAYSRPCRSRPAQRE